MNKIWCSGDIVCIMNWWQHVVQLQIPNYITTTFLARTMFLHVKNEWLLNVIFVRRCLTLFQNAGNDSFHAAYIINHKNRWCWCVLAATWHSTPIRFWRCKWTFHCPQKCTFCFSPFSVTFKVILIPKLAKFHSL
jgi:hypothetical protein